MFVVDALTSSTYRQEHSTFIAYLVPFKQYESLLKDLREEHKKAVHFVRASRIYNEYSQIIESSSDDGEPKGSSGVPVLNVMRGNELIDCAIIVVRYFGGKLLGVGGLIRAYTKASLAVIAESKLIEFEKSEVISLEIPLREVQRAKYLANKLGVGIISFDFNADSATIHAKVNQKNSDSFKRELMNWS